MTYQKQVVYSSAVVAKAMAPDKALILVAQRHWSSIKIRTDSSLLVRCMQGETHPPIEISLLVDQSFRFKSCFLHCTFKKVGKVEIQGAHRLVAQARIVQLLLCQLHCITHQTKKLSIQLDSKNNTYSAGNGSNFTFLFFIPHSLLPRLRGSN